MRGPPQWLVYKPQDIMKYHEVYVIVPQKPKWTTWCVSTELRSSRCLLVRIPYRVKVTHRPRSIVLRVAWDCPWVAYQHWMRSEGGIPHSFDTVPQRLKWQPRVSSLGPKLQTCLSKIKTTRIGKITGACICRPFLCVTLWGVERLKRSQTFDQRAEGNQ